MATRPSRTGPLSKGPVDSVTARPVPRRPDDTHPGRTGRQAQGDLRGGLEAKRVAQRRMRQRRRRAGVLTLLLTSTGLVAVDLVRGGSHAAEQPPPAAAVPAAKLPAAPAATTATAPISSAPQPTHPATGRGTFRYAAGEGSVLGSAGAVRRFHVAVEDGVGQDVAFAEAVDAILGDPRGWIATKQLRLQRVPKATSAGFTVFLATPGTSATMCAAGGLYTEGFSSCRLPGQVIINLARWLAAVPDYGAPLEVYQAYAINHEVGHQLGYGHEACPSAGQPAPVMQQQTYGLQGCTANGWPYLDGRRYRGPAIP